MNHYIIRYYESLVPLNIHDIFGTGKIRYAGRQGWRVRDGRFMAVANNANSNSVSKYHKNFQCFRKELQHKEEK